MVESTTPYRRVLESRSLHAGPRSVTRDLKASSTSDSSEANYWTEKFGFGANGHHGHKKYANPRSLRVQAGTASVVHQILISPTAMAKKVSIAKHTLMAVACGPRVPLYGTTPQSSFHRTLLATTGHRTGYDSSAASSSSKTPLVLECDRQVPTSGQLALSIAVRADGRLLAIGTDTGVVRVADTTSRVTLCQLFLGSNNNTSGSRRSRHSIRSVAWFRDGLHLLAAGDDGVLRVWQFNDKRCVVECRGHGDAIRCANLWQTAKTVLHGCPTTMVATGGYDHTVRVWDMENLEDDGASRCMSVLDHGAPVEALQWIKSSNAAVPMWLVSAGGCNLKVWNPLSGACVVSLQAFHRKTITCLVTMPRKNFVTGVSELRLLTGGLDGLMRVYSWDKATGELKFLHGVNLNKEGEPVSITALACSFSGDKLAIGTSAGEVLVKQRGELRQTQKYLEQLRKYKADNPTAGTYSFFRRGMHARPEEGDHVVAVSKKKRRLASFDVAMKQFRHSDALDEALATDDPLAVISVLEELGRRHSLIKAISNRDEESLLPLLNFVAKYVQRPGSAALLLHVATKLIDIYGRVAVAESSAIDTRNAFAKLRQHVHDECLTQKKLLRLAGQIDALVTKAG